ncbi:hypothetical protein [Parasphingorhabdus pacifica]
MTFALETILARAGLRVTAEEFLSQVESAAKRLTTPAADPATHFTHSERQALSAAGLDLTPLDSEEFDPRARTVAEQAVLRDTALSVNQAADRVGVDSSRIRHRISNGHLVGWKDRGGWRLPAWQFTDDDVLPGLETVLAAMPADQPALVLANFMTTQQEDLDLAERPVSPREWLMAGGSAHLVARLASVIGNPA